MKQTERGWQGHFIRKCRFHLNTLLNYKGFKIIVSTVGNYVFRDKMQTIGVDKYYETMVFESKYDEWDSIEVTKNIYFNSKWAYSGKDEMPPQKGHWKVVAEIKEKMINGDIIPKGDLK